MSHLRRPLSRSSYDDSEPLSDRVAQRVMNARIAIDRSGSMRGRTQSRAQAADVGSPGEAERRERASLKRVFRDLGTSYRRYRKQTGSPVLPELREAAYRFRATPTLASLTAVAAFLDQLDLLS
jgi:hypothetical protein